MKKYTFFTLNNFTLDGGGRVRIYGILNALASQGKDVTLISNVIDKSKFNSDIKHTTMNLDISFYEKKLFQFSLAIFPNFINKIIFSKYLKAFKEKIDENLKNEIIFFEYLDNSFGYFYKVNGLIDSYVNDIHGIAPLEFAYNESKGIKKVYNLLRYEIAKILDFKVMEKADKVIVVSEAMKRYFLNNYTFLEDKIIVIRDGVSKKICTQNIDNDLLKIVSQKYKNDNKKIIFFAGNFKDLGGVLDLVHAFIKLADKRDDIKLFLIGDGEHFNNAKKLITNTKLDKLVYFLGRVPYAKLKTYQQIADVIVCPDKKHPYSDILLHIKYFDSLISNKVVINGNFKAVQEINKNQSISIDFEPSDINDLMDKINYVLNNLSVLNEKYKHNSEVICQNYTYESFVKGF